MDAAESIAVPEGEVVVLRRSPPPDPQGNGAPPVAGPGPSEADGTILLPGEPPAEAGLGKPAAEDDPPLSESEAEAEYAREAAEHHREDEGGLRRQLLAGAAVVSVLFVAGAGLVLISGHSRQSTIAAAPPPVVAPAASLAQVPVKPQPKSVTLAPYHPPPPNTEVAQIEGIKDGAPQQAQPVAAPPPVGLKPGAPASQAVPKSPPPAHPAVTPETAVAAVQHLQAAPMATADQVQVLEVVTQMAALVREDKLEIANLQSDLHTNEAATQAKLADFERRLALAEAHTALTAAAAPVQAPQPAIAVAPVDPVPAALAAAHQAVAQAAAPSPTKPPPVSPPAPQASPVAAVPAQYRVQAASPGLAMLARVDQSGGDAAQIQVQVGDSLPGWGRILSIGQQGTAWVVTTQHGPIE